MTGRFLPLARSALSSITPPLPLTRRSRGGDPTDADVLGERSGEDREAEAGLTTEAPGVPFLVAEPRGRHSFFSGSFSSPFLSSLASPSSLWSLLSFFSSVLLPSPPLLPSLSPKS